MSVRKLFLSIEIRLGENFPERKNQISDILREKLQEDHKSGDKRPNLISLAHLSNLVVIEGGMRVTCKQRIKEKLTLAFRFKLIPPSLLLFLLEENKTELLTWLVVRPLHAVPIVGVLQLVGGQLEAEDLLVDLSVGP